jgi:RNA polymerase sigma-70 factor (subfamily 1)
MRRRGVSPFWPPPDEIRLRYPKLRCRLGQSGIRYAAPGTMSPPTSTCALLEKAVAGNQEALSLAFERHRGRLIVLAHFKMSTHARQRAEAEDVVQETMLRAFRDLNRFSYRTPGSFFRWLASILDHVIVDRARYLGRERRAGEEVPFRSQSNPRGPEPVDSQTPSRLMSQSEGVGRLLERLSSLPEDYRQAILLAKIEGLTTAEMAERLGKSREAVAVLVYRAVKRFRALTEAARP